MSLREKIQAEINQFLSSNMNSENFNGNLPKKSTELSPRQSRKKAIVQFSLGGEFIREFSSISEAESFFGLSDKYISKHLRGKTKTCAGFVFKFKNL
ncbi:MAG: hypothetical protein RL308_477 [Bacteroidota bacterium]|jgi:hypothetical protein